MFQDLLSLLTIAETWSEPGASMMEGNGSGLQSDQGRGSGKADDM